MKNILLALFLTASVISGNSQYSKVIVQFTDKAGSSYSLSNPSAFLTARAVQRRTRFNIPYDSTDLPITQRYIDSIRSAGNVTILSRSKWLNQILISTTDQTAINKIQSYSFVKKVAAIAPRPAGSVRADKFKETIEPLNSDNKAAARATGNVYDYGNSYNQVHIHKGEFLHNKGFTGSKIQMTVLDAGFNQYKTITAFDSVRMNGQILGERDFVDYDNSVNEDDSHGRFCLSIMCANWPGRMVGTAPKTKYWLIRTENAATEYPVEEHNWVAGAEFADSTGSDMISSSLGYYDFDDPSFNHSYNDFYKNSTMVTKGAALAVRKGMIVMNSAGNEGNNSWRYIIFPADADSVCTVGAVNNSGVIASFSSHGYPGKIKPSIVSVGAGTVIASANNQPSSGNGTSFSNPNMAGLIACLWDAFPDFSNMKILDAVYKSADRYNNPDSLYGYGIPDFQQAYLALKHEQNTILYPPYPNEFLFATPNPFGGQIDAKFIGRTEGNAALYLKTMSGDIIAQQKFTTEKEEVYAYSFLNLDYLPQGDYIVQYKDSVVSHNVVLKKSIVNNPDWFAAFPNPFSTDFIVYYKAQDSGEVNVRLIDAKGSVIETVKAIVSKNEGRTFKFKSSSRLLKGTYYIQYISKTTNRVIKVVKA